MKKIWIFIGVLLIAACSREKHSGQQHGPNEARVFKVGSGPFQQTLYFSGVIKPLSLASISAPYDSVIVEKKVNFGQNVKRGDELFKIESSQLEKEYDAALSGYLKAKDDASTAETKFTGTTDLWKLGLISKNEYISQQSNLNNLKVSLLQKERELEDMFKKIGREDVGIIKKLKLSDTEGVGKALQTKLGQIEIDAPATGVLLEPPKTSSTDGDKPIEVGSDVKQGSPLGLIGNMEGVSISIKISEIDLQKVKPGMSAEITGVAFPGESLKGEVVRVNSQASSTGTDMSGLPSFSGEVIVKSLSESQKQVIKVGMTAKVEVHTETSQDSRVPIQAVYEEHGQSFVKKKIEGRFEAVPVVTGPATPDAVVIKEGVKDGDEILVPGKP